MSNTKKSKKLLIIATTLMIIGLASVLTVYATVVLGNFTGGTVTVGGVSSGTVQYSLTNDEGATWSTTLSAATGADWYARLDITGGYAGSATVSFQLQQNTGGGWSNVGSPVTTGTITLTGNAQIVYASSNGGITGNNDWKQSSGGAYQIVVAVNSV